MFEHIENAPPDAILGLSEDFKRDPNPRKINLGVGVYQDEAGQTPILNVVKEAEKYIIDNEPTKNYLPIDGREQYGADVRELLFGDGHHLATDPRVVSAHTPGGTGALRLAFDLLRRARPEAKLWLSRPSWPNHPQICNATGLVHATYPYFNSATNGLAFEPLLDSLMRIEPGDAIVLHACCHNPTGVDPTPEQWTQIARCLADRQVLPIVDFAYQGFATGLDEDAESIRILSRELPELMVCSSFSKNFALYNERVGALTIVTASASAASAVRSQVKQSIRANYSNPPAHGAAIVTTVLANSDLRRQWRQELAAMRQRIRRMRRLFTNELDQRKVRLADDGNGFIARQHGMFSFSGLDGDQVAALRSQHSVYIVGSGRVSVAGMTENNMPALCDAIVDVVRGRQKRTESTEDASEP